MAGSKKLGDLLIEAGLIDDFQLQAALSHQRNWGGKLGSILIELEFVREEDIAKVIAEKLRIPYVNLFDPVIPEAVIRLIKPDIAKKYHVMPAKKDSGALYLAMSDPLDIEAIDAIRFVTGLNIRPALAMSLEINDAIRKYYDGEDVVRTRALNPVIQRGHSSGGKMEIIRGSDLTMHQAEETSTSSHHLSKDDNAQQALVDNRLRVEALISLLIEKGLITRDEIVSMIYQKKMGI